MIILYDFVALHNFCEYRLTGVLSSGSFERVNLTEVSGDLSQAYTSLEYARRI